MNKLMTDFGSDWLTFARVMPFVFIGSDRGHVVLNVLRMLVSFSEVVASESSGNSERSEEEDSEPDTEPETEPENTSVTKRPKKSVSGVYCIITAIPGLYVDKKTGIFQDFTSIELLSSPNLYPYAQKFLPRP